MNLDAVPILSMLKDRLGYVSRRQQVLSQNVANASTPRYTPQDLKPFSFDMKLKAAAAGGAGTPAMTDPAHMQGRAGPSVRAWTSAAAPDSETTLDGNQVVLEEQMIKMSEARMDYEAAVGFYQKSMNLIRTAARGPGR